MIRTLSALLAVSASGLAVAQTPQLQISLGVRESSTSAAIGADGGTFGGIEWVNLDGQVLTLNGNWQQFTFRLDPADPNADTLTPYTGMSADGMLEGSAGVIEHIRILNFQGITEPIELWIDDVANTITPTGGSPTTTVFGEFEGFADDDEVMFQEPRASGATRASIAAPPAPDVSGIYNRTASRAAPGSVRVAFQFFDDMPVRWLRLTTNDAPSLPNPTVRFDQLSEVTFWMRGGKGQADLGFQGPGTAFAEMVGSGLGRLEGSGYAVAGIPPSAPGVLTISQNGGVDIPAFNGVLVSFSNFILLEPLIANSIGQAAIALPGSPIPFDAVIQSGFLDTSLPGEVPITLTNAINAVMGQ